MKHVAAVTTILLLLVAVPLAASTTPCAKLSLLASPSYVHPLGPLTLTASITNCLDALERLAITYEVTGPGFSETYTIRFRLLARQSLHSSITVPAPPIPGLYTMKAAVASGGTILDKCNHELYCGASTGSVSGKRGERRRAGTAAPGHTSRHWQQEEESATRAGKASRSNVDCGQAWV